MFSVLRRPYFIGAFLPPFLSDNYPYDIPDKPIAVEVPKDGWSRVKAIFRSTKYETMTPEFATMYQTTVLGFFFGSFYGGVIVSRSAYQDFMDSNQATRFLGQTDAKRRIQDAVTMGFIRGAIKWGSRIAFFTAMYSCLTTVISVYRDKNTIFEYSVAGFLAGAIYKIPIGFRGMFAGGLVGCVLSTFCGMLSLGLMKLSGTTIQDHRAFHQRSYVSRENVEAKLILDQREKEEKAYAQYVKREKTGEDIIHKSHKEKDNLAKTIDGLPEDDQNKTISNKNEKPEDVKK